MTDAIEALKNEVLEKRLAFKEVLSRFLTSAPGEVTHPTFLFGYEPSRHTIDPVKLRNCRVVPSRHQIIDEMTGTGEAIEIGTQTGAFAQYILDTHKDLHLHAVDIDYSIFKHDELRPYVDSGRLNIIEGFSWDELAKFPDDHFEWIYIDASHFYDHVKKDLDCAKNKVKTGGFIICNDYTCWSPFESEPYGVLQAVNEFLATELFEASHIGLDSYGYHDIALRRLR